MNEYQVRPIGTIQNGKDVSVKFSSGFTKR